jgi:hypothetical protein
MEEKPICGTCGETLDKIHGEYTCKTCELFFGISSIIKICSRCKDVYGIYPKVDRAVLSFLSDYHIKKNLWEDLCPECRVIAYKESRMYKETGRIYVPTYTTTREIIRDLMQKRAVTLRDFEMKGIPSEFIKFCLK